MSDTFTSYETGLSLLLKRLGHAHPRYAEALTLQARLLENLARVRRYGDTETGRAERAQIVDALNRLALEAVGRSFNALRLFRRLEDTDGIAVAQEALGSLALQTARLPEAVASLQEARQGYATLRRSERIRAVDDLLRIAHQARQPVGGTAL